MNFSDCVRPRKIITIRYRDKYVDLVSDTDRYGTMTQNAEGDRIEFDFSECRVIGIREIPVTDNQYENIVRELKPDSYYSMREPLLIEGIE